METRTAKLAATALIFNEDKSQLLGVKSDTLLPRLSLTFRNIL